MPLDITPRASVSFRLQELYSRYGYTPYRMSKFEPYDLYAGNRSFLVSPDILTFTDTTGQLMALKPDVTLSIIKNASPLGDALEKVYYHERVYRTSPAAIGFREIPQTGLECIGALDAYTMGEVLTLAVRSLAIIGSEYSLNVGHMGIIAGLLEGLDPKTSQDVLQELGRKNAAGVRAICTQASVKSAQTACLCSLTTLYGFPQEVLPQLKTLIQGENTETAFHELETLCTMLEKGNLAENVKLDFSIVSDHNYYNGLTFQGYLSGLPSKVLSGGRYDNLLRKMGKQGGAIGFAVYLDQLDRFLSPSQRSDGDILLLYQTDDDPAAVAKTAQALAADGRSVRVERQVPEGLTFDRIVRYREGEDVQ